MILANIGKGLACLSLPLILAAASPAWLAPPVQEPATTQAPPEEVLEDHMLTMKSGLRRLRRSLRDPGKFNESIVTILRVQQANLEAKTFEPRMTTNVPEAEKEAFLKAYQKELALMGIELQRLEIAVLDGDLEGAQAILKKVQAMEEPAHERFMDDE